MVLNPGYLCHSGLFVILKSSKRLPVTGLQHASCIADSTVITSFSFFPGKEQIKRKILGKKGHQSDDWSHDERDKSI